MNHRLVNILLSMFLVSALAAADYDTVNHDDGSLHYKIKLNRDGQRDGKYTCYFPSGKPKKKGKKQEIGTYKDGKLHGMRSFLNEKSQLIKEELYFFGDLVYPSSERFIKMKFEMLKQEAKASVAAMGTLKNENAASADVLAAVLARANSYRFLAGVPTDVAFRDDYIHYAQEGAELCQAIGNINHHPKNPGWPEQAFKDGYKGCSHGNLFNGRNGPATIDGYIDDSDDSNRDRVGHRRWILWKDLAHIGHGDAGRMSCLYVIGEAKAEKSPVPFTSWPSKGFVPMNMFGAHYAWHCAPQKGWYSIEKNAELNIYHLNPKTYKKHGDPLPIKFRNVDKGGFGRSHAIIAQPDQLPLKAGASFVVEVTGVKKLKENAPDLSWVVTFF